MFGECVHMALYPHTVQMGVEFVYKRIDARLGLTEFPELQKGGQGQANTGPSTFFFMLSVLRACLIFVLILIFLFYFQTTLKQKISKTGKYTLTLFNPPTDRPFETIQNFHFQKCPLILYTHGDTI